MRLRPHRAAGAMAVTAVLAATFAAPPTATPVAAAPAARQAAPAVPADPSTVAPGERDRLLPRGWAASTDLAWTTSGDSTGFHLLVATSATGYTWRTVATLAEPAVDTDQWIGNACLTASGKRAVVVYEPRAFTNRGHLYDRGAFAAVVDIATGAVTKLGVNVSIAYYNPGCGAGETAVLTQAGAADLGRTRLHVVDTVRRKITTTRQLTGQVTSAVPLGDRIAAAAAGRVIAVGAGGAVTTLARTGAVAAYLRPDAARGLAFLEPKSGGTAVARYVSGGRSTRLATGPQSDLGLQQGTGGRVFLTGTPSQVGALPAHVRRIGAPADSAISTTGALAVRRTTAPARPAGPARATTVGLQGRFPATGGRLDFQVKPGARTPAAVDLGRSPSPALAAAAGGRRQALVAGSPTSPVDDDRYCSVPRNDLGNQVEQPHWRQVEWAADLAVQGALTMTRPAGWHATGLPAWSPQDLEKPIALAGGGRVPAQVMLGILAQESNLWQASPHALEGVPGNPLIGSYYGLRDLWDIDWTKADCGFGVGQVTDGMRLAGHGKPGEVIRPLNEQRAIAVDYATNIAAGLRILQSKWNQTYGANIRINDADPARPENWFAAVWAYNSGLNPQATTGNTTGCTPGPSCDDGPRHNWGLGWGNNPANPDYPYDRKPFLNGGLGEGSPSDASHPQNWPYPEKVMGWAAYPIVKTDYRDGSWSQGYLQAWWNSDVKRGDAIKPVVETFCTTANNCSVDEAGKGACGYSDYHCWWHWPAISQESCADNCGHENLRYAPGAAEPARGTHYPPTCRTDGLPTGALVVDDVPAGTGIVRSDGCAAPLTNNGTMSWQFSGTTTGEYWSKRDFHQIGSGVNGHFWFSHEYNPDQDAVNHVGVTGTWQLDRRLDAWARVFVHMPAQGGESQQAHYKVDRGADAAPAATRYKTRTLHQRQGGNTWVPLGVFDFHGTPRVSLSNLTANTGGLGSDNVVWDAIAFQTLPAKPKDFVVSLGESFSSGEGAATNADLDYFYDSNNDGDGNVDYRNGCHRSRYAWSRLAFLADDPMQRTIGERADTLDPAMDYHLLACSGAETEMLLPSGREPVSGVTTDDPTTGTAYVNAWNQPARGARREVSQLDEGFLDENTTLVTLSIGGNDVKWSATVENCILDLVECQDTQIDGQRAGDYIPGLIADQMRTSVATVLRAVSQQAPNARIILMGYPQLISDTGACFRISLPLPSDFTYGLTAGEAAWLNQLADQMAGTLRAVVNSANAQGIKARFADPIANLDFDGKTVCGQPETFHRLVLGQTAGEKPNSQHRSQQSFHPKIEGARIYSFTLDRELRNWQM